MNHTQESCLRYCLSDNHHAGTALMQRLEDSDYSITEISELLKFPTPSHFAATFRKVVGVTPSALRLRPDLISADAFRLGFI
jgi:AraC-like DNA-binding protein